METLQDILSDLPERIDPIKIFHVLDNSISIDFNLNYNPSFLYQFYSNPNFKNILKGVFKQYVENYLDAFVNDQFDLVYKNSIIWEIEESQFSEEDLECINKKIGLIEQSIMKIFETGNMLE